MNTRHRRIRQVGTAICEAFALITMVVLAARGRDGSRVLLAAATMLFVLLPEALERVFRCKLWTPLYVFALLYALGPMLGYSLRFYYLLPGWDKVLHISGGILFAVAGVCIYQRLAGGNPKPMVTAIFALCFSMAISMVWEFYEFGSDRLLHTDMQDDRVITKLHSHYLDETPGEIGSIEHITVSAINGETMSWNGYLDIGLLDTMWDMILETMGALVVAAYLVFSRGKHPLVQPAAK